MELTYRKLEAVLVAHLAIDPDRVPTFRSRIKQLQRLNFPSGVNVGRGEKMVYSGAHLFKLVTAFELIGTGMPAQFATQLVERHWDVIAAGYGLAHRHNLAIRTYERVYVRFVIRTLHEIQSATKRDQSPSAAYVEDEHHLHELFASPRQRTAWCYPVLCVSDLTSRVTNLAQSIGGILEARYDFEPITWLPPAANTWLLVNEFPRNHASKGSRAIGNAHGDEASQRFIEIMNASGLFTGEDAPPPEISGTPPF
jgi:hypothetical protein